ncbi:unnamed protein product [Darwinula stevensoni]|uniref:Perilipin n=1 Tax=Darwinula stevensoni TaxID=69355 RepID=A0A7R8X2E5_9CRUS|nr:unnamed protein product [Darwinula stevensoni]CAG0881365.1 unnamed protein product [Darwinula stevensoni]
MYRKQQLEMDGEVMVERNPLDLECLRRMWNLPAVSAAVNYAADMYGKAKEKPYMGYGLGVAEAGMQRALHGVLPLVARCEVPLTMVDKMACKGLDVLEQSVPIIKEEPHQVLEETKAYVATKAKPTAEMVNAILKYGGEKFHGSLQYGLDSKHVKLALKTIEQGLHLTDAFIAQYLPPDEKGFKPAPTGTSVDPSLEAVMDRGYQIRCHLTHLVQWQFLQLQHRSMDTITQLSGIINMLGWSKEQLHKRGDSLKSMTHSVRKQLQSWEGDVIARARNLAQHLVSVYEQSHKYMPEQAQMAIDRAHHFASTIYNSLPNNMTELKEDGLNLIHWNLSALQSTSQELLHMAISFPPLSYVVSELQAAWDSNSEEAQSRPNQDGNPVTNQTERLRTRQ